VVHGRLSRVRYHARLSLEDGAERLCLREVVRGARINTGKAFVKLRFLAMYLRKSIALLTESMTSLFTANITQSRKLYCMSFLSPSLLLSLDPKSLFLVVAVCQIYCEKQN
jgi:hypothetical protein